MKYSKKLILSVAAVTIGLGVGSVAVMNLGTVTATNKDPRLEAPLVQIAEVRPSSKAERAFTGLISAQVQSNLGFRVNGKVTNRYVDAGQRAQAGQPLMRIDQKDLDLALTAKENAVLGARAVAIQAVADEARYSKLVADGWAPQQRYEQAKAARDNANAQLAAVEAQAEVARNEAGYSVLTADADGIVVETLAEPGQVVAAGQVVVKLARAGSREATVNLPETVRPEIGSTAEATLYGGNGTRFPAQLRQLSNSADPLTRTFEARYVLNGDAASAPLGATVTVWIHDPNVPQLAEVPLGAILDDGRSTGVWVLDSATSTVTLRVVQIHTINQETATVVGVAPGERVVALGAHMLNRGQRVRVAELRAAAQ